jgi:translation initiation factor 2 subunit 2
MSEEPLFDPSLKKRSKKKQVAFSEDPLAAEADPTVPAGDFDLTTTSGEVVDLGPKTVHEQMKQSVDDGAEENGNDAKEDDDFKAMFGDLKKKKKKKEIPLDLVCCTLLLIDGMCFLITGYIREMKVLVHRRLLLLLLQTILTSPI